MARMISADRELSYSKMRCGKIGMKSRNAQYFMTRPGYAKQDINLTWPNTLILIAYLQWIGALSWRQHGLRWDLYRIFCQSCSLAKMLTIVESISDDKWVSRPYFILIGRLNICREHKIFSWMDPEHAEIVAQVHLDLCFYFYRPK